MIFPVKPLTLAMVSLSCFSKPNIEELLHLLEQWKHDIEPLANDPRVINEGLKKYGF
ncbi:putative lipid II flippase FtsW [Sesbania bispinosa]|nr:putative lipid II flippase FtsW [Sesbania bispinosa]